MIAKTIAWTSAAGLFWLLSIVAFYAFAMAFLK